MDDLNLAIELSGRELRQSKNIERMPPDLRRKAMTAHLPVEYELEFLEILKILESELRMDSRIAERSALKCVIANMQEDMKKGES